jgi:hypothetical protein
LKIGNDIYSISAITAFAAVREASKRTLRVKAF